MKKLSLIAAASLLASGAFAQTAAAPSPATVYGVIDLALVATTFAGPGNGTTVGLNAGGQSGISGSRLGFKGSRDFGAGLSGIYTLEAGFNPQNGTSAGGALFGRQAWAGIKGEFGEVTAGRQYSPQFMFFAHMDPMWGTSNANDTVPYLAYVRSGNNPYGAIRVNNSVRYANDSGPWHVEVLHGFGNASNSPSVGQVNGAFTMYSGKDYSLAFAVHSSNQNSDATTNNGKSGNAAVGGTYNISSDLKLMANYQASSFNVQNNSGVDSSNLTTVGINYTVSKKVDLVAALYRDIGKSAITGTSGNRSTVGLGATYAFTDTDTVYTYADHTIQTADYANGLGSDAASDAALASTGKKPTTNGSTLMIGYRKAF